MTRVVRLLVSALCLFGCSLEAGVISRSDSGDGAVRDADGDAADAADAADAMDATVGDSDPGVDTGTPPADTGAPPPTERCPGPVENDVMLFDFEDIDGAIRTVSANGRHEGAVANSAATTRPGPPGCGVALYQMLGQNRFVMVPDSEEFQLTRGSIDLWFFLGLDVRFPSGLVSRDAGNTRLPGHINLQLDRDGRLDARLQRESGVSENITGPAPEREVWHHVGLQFGDGEFVLWLDGEVVASAEVEGGIDGNMNPFVIGVLNANAEEGSYPPSRVRDLAKDVAIDHVRLDTSRRDFAGYAALAPVAAE